MVLPTVLPVTIITLFTPSSEQISGIFLAQPSPMTVLGAGNSLSMSGRACSEHFMDTLHLTVSTLSISASYFGLSAKRR